MAGSDLFIRASGHLILTTSPIILSPLILSLAIQKIAELLSMRLVKVAMAEALRKLSALGGAGKFEEREWRIRVRTGWHTKARTAIRHMLQGERQLSAEETREIEVAHLKYCAEKVKSNAAETEALFNSMRTAIDAMQTSDPEFFAPTIEAVRELLLRPGDMARTRGDEDTEAVG